MSLCFGLKLFGRDIHIFGPPGCRWFLLFYATAYTVALMALWCALRYLPIGEATAIVYLHPVVCGLLAHVLLKEPLGSLFWMQATISCIGVALVANVYGVIIGTSDSIDRGGFIGKGLALVSCMCFASAHCVVRFMPRCHPLEVQVFTDSLIALVAMPVVLHLSGVAGDWDMWTQTQAMLLVIFSAFGLATSFLAITGFKMAPATIAALFMYLEVPTSFAVQVMFFGQVPGMAAVSGATLITVAAITRLVYEANRSRDDAVDVALFPSPNSLDLNEDVLDPLGKGISRQGTLESCLGPYILAGQASAKPYMPFMRNMTDNPTSRSLFSPLTGTRQSTV